MGTGGVPDITFQEVADALSTLPNLAKRYARYKYANDDRNLIYLKAMLLLYAIKSPGPHRGRVFWEEVVAMAIEFHAHHKVFGVGRKARRSGRRHWTRLDEDCFVSILNVLDHAEFELRRAFREWNEANT